MPKQRKDTPPHVTFKKGRWVYQPYLGKGKRGKEIPLRWEKKLLRKDAPRSRIWACWEELVNQPSDTLSWLVNKYLKSEQFKRLALNTQKVYQIYANTILTMPMKSGKMFGHVPFGSITPGVIRKYLDKREAKILANREVEFMSSVFGWAFERDFCTSNPCRGVRKNPERSRTRYIEDWEYELVYNLALNSGTKYIAAMMEIAYLCRARRIEISERNRGIDYGIKMNQIDKTKGIYIHREKGSLPEWTLWSERLKDAIKLCRSINRDVISPYLIHDKQGQPIQDRAFSSAWQRLMKKAIAAGIKERFTFHDIKAKGVSDHKNNESGHKSERAKAVYMRKTKETDSTR